MRFTSLKAGLPALLLAMVVLSFPIASAEPKTERPGATAPETSKSLSSDALSVLDRTFLKTVAQGGKSEISTSELALKKSKNTGVQTVANRLIREHSKVDLDLQTTAEKLRFVLPKEPDAAQKATAARLAELNGAAFNKAYLKTQATDHDKTIALFREEIAKGQNPEVKQFAKTYLPKIQAHNELIQKIASEENASKTSSESESKAKQ